VQATLDRRNWGLVTTPEVEARGFCSTVLGVVLERAALGEAFDPATAEAAVLLVLNLHPDQLAALSEDTQKSTLGRDDPS
jgi:hypothetical protein